MDTIEDATAAPAEFSVLATWLAVLFGGVFLLLLITKQSKSKSGKSYPPYPKGSHLLWGHAAQLPDITKGYHVDPKLLEWAKELGPVFSMKLPVVGTMICVADPELIKYITISKNYNKSWTYKANLPLFGERSIVMVPNGEEWKMYRKTLAPAFTTAFLKDMVFVMCDKIDRMLSCLDQDVSNKVPSHMVQRTQTLTSDVIVQIGFGEDWGGEKPHAANGYIREMTEITIVLAQDIMAILFGFKMKRRLKALESNLNAIMNEIVDQRLQQIKEGKLEGEKANVCALVVQSLMQPDGTLTSEDRLVILHQLKTIFFAGFDTTSSTISWTAWLLSQHHDIIENLRAELKAKNIFNTPNQRPTYEQLQECEYLDAVVKEVLRLYPPGASARYVASPEESWKDYKLGGAVLYVNCYVTHRLPQYWDCPDDFLPERFVGVNPGEYAHKYFPFLKGPRDCLGKYFALLEVKLAVSAMVQRYNMTCSDPNEAVGYRLTAYPLGGACVQLQMREKEDQ